jgi:cytochrome P450
MGAVPLAPGFPRLEEALELLGRFVGELVDDRRARPRADFISALIAAQASEAQLTDDEIVWNLVNLLFAGQDTTRYQLASAARVLAAAPGAWNALADDPGLVPAALEETMRLRPVSQFVVRRVDRPVAAGGFRFPARRRIILNLLAAARDPDTFPDPDRYDPGREVTYRLPFGWGHHYCLGHALARAEMCEALSLLTASVADVEIGNATDAPAAAMLGGPERLPVRFRRR